jgi:septal ring factor EnvC (AmiA/AmiB activator)
MYLLRQLFCSVILRLFLVLLPFAGSNGGSLSGMSKGERVDVLRAEIAARKAAVKALDHQRESAQDELQRVEAELAALEDAHSAVSSNTGSSGTPAPTTATEKVALFRSLFRRDVYPKPLDQRQIWSHRLRA